MRYPVAILAVAAVALAACERTANTAYNNSGKDAATAPGPMADNTRGPAPATGADSPNARTSTATSDTASPNVAPAGAPPAADESGTSRKIMTAITSDSGMKDADVTVKTENGVVTLGGTVKSQDQVTIATGIAQKQEGVARVESKIALQ